MSIFICIFLLKYYLGLHVNIHVYSFFLISENPMKIIQQFVRNVKICQYSIILY